MIKSDTLARLRELLTEYENWPTVHDLPSRVTSPIRPWELQAKIIELHKLTDEALPALLDIAEAAQALRDEPLRAGEPTDAGWVRLLEALASLDSADSGEAG